MPRPPVHPLRGPGPEGRPHLARPGGHPQRPGHDAALRAQRRLRPGRPGRRRLGDRARRRGPALLVGPRPPRARRPGRRCASGETVGTWCGFGCAGAEAQMAREKEIYLGFSERWRNIPKPTIAAGPGQGHRRRADARVAVRHHRRRRQRRVHRQHRRDGRLRRRVLPPPVGGRHPAGQGDAASRPTPSRPTTPSGSGMVNHVVALDDLQPFALALAEKIAQQPLFALKMTKEAVNAAQDNQGRVAGAGDVVRPPPAVPQPQPAGPRHGHRPELPDGHGEEPTVTDVSSSDPVPAAGEWQ